MIHGKVGRSGAVTHEELADERIGEVPHQRRHVASDQTGDRPPGHLPVAVMGRNEDEPVEFAVIAFRQDVVQSRFRRRGVELFRFEELILLGHLDQHLGGLPVGAFGQYQRLLLGIRQPRVQYVADRAPRVLVFQREHQIHEPSGRGIGPAERQQTRHVVEGTEQHVFGVHPQHGLVMTRTLGHIPESITRHRAARSGSPGTPAARDVTP